MFAFKRSVPFIELFDAGGRLISECALGEYRLPEASVIRLSLAYYADPEPCEIHRAAVTQRAMIELASIPGADRRLDASALSAEQREYFPAETRFIRIAERKK